jgi:hypothetical protein
MEGVLYLTDYQAGIKEVIATNPLMSDIVLSNRVSPAEVQEDAFCRNGFRVIPNPAGSFDKKKPLYVYFELYHLPVQEKKMANFSLQYRLKLIKKYEANVFIDCILMAHTRPGVPARDVLQKGIDAYQEKGYPEEWKLHHQGGSIGYTGRDYRVNFNAPDLIQENQAFTWNPSIAGTKSEDTILATSKGPEMITHPILYPTLSMTVEGISFKRPAILVKR